MASTPSHRGFPAEPRDRTRSQAIVDLLLAEACPADGVVPTPQTPLSDGGLELTSLALVRAIVNIEESLGLDFSDTTFMDAELRTVADVLALVESESRSDEDPNHTDD
ncbi:acyl carrier protein [Nonomuraea sp. NPDC003707]